VSVVELVEPLVRAGIGPDMPVRLKCWHGSEIGSPSAPVQLTFTSPRALRRVLWAPNHLGFARAYVSGDVLIDSDLWRVCPRWVRSAGRGVAARALCIDPAGVGGEPGVQLGQGCSTDQCRPARVWLLYMAGSALAFEGNRIGVNQVLAVRPDARGVSGMPRSRASMLAPVVTPGS
jgi:hypothetical protein